MNAPADSAAASGLFDRAGVIDPLENLSHRIDYLQGQWATTLSSPLKDVGWTSTWVSHG